MPLIVALVALCCRYARVVVTAFVLAGLGAGLYTALHFNMDTDSAKLISPKLPWRQREIRFDRLFPQRNNLILVVIDGATPERAEEAASLLAAKLGARKDLFPIVRRPDGGAYFEQNGLLFLSEEDVAATTNALIKAQPFLGTLASDPSLRGVMDSLSIALKGVARGDAKLADLKLAGFADTLGEIASGGSAFLPWQSLITGRTSEQRTRNFLEVQPALDFNALSPGAAASDAIRQAARDLELTQDQGVSVRLTGPVPLQDEEFATLAERAWLMGMVMLLAVTATLWLAVRSFRIIAAILVTLFVGLALTMAIGLAEVGTFNIISIAFVALFVGIGVDFAIQFSVRYRAERFAKSDLRQALIGAGKGVGTPLALAALATAAGFFSFLPTDYVGVAELGLIAGIGMIVALVLAVTMLPALLMLMQPESEAEEIGFSALAPLDRFLIRRRGPIRIAAALLGIAALASVAFLKVDFNPLDLRSRKVESMATLYDLMKDPQTSPNTIDVLAPSLGAAEQLTGRLMNLPEVGQVLMLEAFIPQDQPKKLAMIADASLLLDATLNPFVLKPPPTDGETVASFLSTAQALRAAAEKDTSDAAADARRLAAALERLAHGDKIYRMRAVTALIPGLNTLLDQLRASLSAQPVMPQSMPKDLVRDWVAPDGTARLQVFPKDTTNDAAALDKFSAAVLKVAPEATGTPISIQQSGNTIMGAFVEAGILSFIAITVMLALILRRRRDVIMTIVPLVLTGLLTLATCVAIRLPLNFANVIALPLLFGIGVAFNIYFVVAWRAGANNLLQSSLTRAVIFSALTTASGFGSLWLSSHPGTASMGELLMISLGWTLATTLFFLPALLGPPPQK